MICISLSWMKLCIFPLFEKYWFYYLLAYLEKICFSLNDNRVIDEGTSADIWASAWRITWGLISTLSHFFTLVNRCPLWLKTVLTTLKKLHAVKNRCRYLIKTARSNVQFETDRQTLPKVYLHFALTYGIDLHSFHFDAHSFL